MLYQIDLFKIIQTYANVLVAQYLDDSAFQHVLMPFLFLVTHFLIFDAMLKMVMVVAFQSHPPPLLMVSLRLMVLVLSRPLGLWS